MAHVLVAVTVIYQEPFWRIVFERRAEKQLSVCKVTVGAEPKDYEIWELILRNYNQLKFSPAIADDVKETKLNPKRMQREVHRQLQSGSIGTKSQQALKLQQEQMKIKRRSLRRKVQEEEKQQQFELKQKKKKEKHRGR